ncbi:MAG: aminodeoxychorismate synthase component I [Pirellulales bacterium]|nr:aminodeoxychorismate synthase component I [Pirellulales bacterium]
MNQSYMCCCATLPSVIYSEFLELPPLRFPFWRYYAPFCGQEYSFLLDSALESPRQGRYSFLGGRPFLAFRAKRRHGVPPPENAEIILSQWVDSQGNWLDHPRVVQRQGDPFRTLRELFTAWRPARCEQPAEISFLGGAVGYWGYEAGYWIEQLPDCGADDLALPDVCLTFPAVVLAHDHAEGRTFLAVFGFGPDEERARAQAAGQQAEMLARLNAFEEGDAIGKETSVSRRRGVRPLPLQAFFDETSYCRAVEDVQNHIAAGDVYQVCLTHRLESPLAGGTAWDLYGILREINPAPFSSYLHFPEVQVVSSSPELFLRLSADGAAESRPMKGTRPRGATPEEDARLRRELQTSVKDLAENAMIVDLVRNDFGRVCAYGSVRVEEYAAIEQYATVYQMVSTVTGRLAVGRDSLDLLRACFPGGSMTGAPKIEAMKIIDRLEPVKRGVYSGAIGYHAFSGAMQLAMTIRTLIVKANRCFFHVGGGIVADSRPEAEYQETLDKAKALLRALETLSENAERKQRKAICDQPSATDP